MATIEEENHHHTTLELLPQREKRTRRSKVSRDELNYRQFVQDLDQQIRVCMKRCLRESRFDTRIDRTLETKSTTENRRNRTSKLSAASSTVSSRSKKDNGTIITSAVSNHQSPMSLLKRNETKRLTDDVQTILTGPALKDFYVQFFRPSQHRLKRSLVYPCN